jgi:hypothetical protein
MVRVLCVGLPFPTASRFGPNPFTDDGNSEHTIEHDVGSRGRCLSIHSVQALMLEILPVPDCDLFAFWISGRPAERPELPWLLLGADASALCWRRDEPMVDYGPFDFCLDREDGPPWLATHVCNHTARRRFRILDHFDARREMIRPVPTSTPRPARSRE